MIKTILISKDENKLNFEISKIKEIEFLGNFSDFSKLEKIELSKIGLIIFDVSSSNLEATIQEIQRIKKLSKNIDFIALSKEINQDLINTLKENEIDNFILKPVLINVLEADIKKIILKKLKLKEQEESPKSIAVFSTKKMCGKTSSAINLSYIISKETEKKVCYLDFNFRSSNNAKDYLKLKNLTCYRYLIEEIENLDENSLLNVLSRYENSSLYVCSFKDKNEIQPTTQNLLKILNALKNVFDYVVIDLDNSINEKNIKILNNTELILLFGILNFHEIVNIQKNSELFSKIGYSNDKVKIIINRFSQNQKNVLQGFEKAIENQVFHTIPNNYLTLADSIVQKKTLEETNPNSNILKSYKELVQKILQTDFVKLSKENSSLHNHTIYSLLKRMGE